MVRELQHQVTVKLMMTLASRPAGEAEAPLPKARASAHPRGSTLLSAGPCREGRLRSCGDERETYRRVSAPLVDGRCALRRLMRLSSPSAAAKILYGGGDGRGVIDKIGRRLGTGCSPTRLRGTANIWPSAKLNHSWAIWTSVGGLCVGGWPTKICRRQELHTYVDALGWSRT